MTTQLAKFLDHNTSEPWDVLFKDFFNTNSFFAPALNTKSTYPTDIYEDDKSVTIEVAAAGLDKQDIDISEEKGILSVTYKKEETSEEDKTNYIQRGIAKRSFCLKWKLSDKFDLTDIKASMDKGILKIEIPKVEEKEIIKNVIKIK